MQKISKKIGFSLHSPLEQLRYIAEDIMVCKTKGFMIQDRRSQGTELRTSKDVVVVNYVTIVNVTTLVNGSEKGTT